MRNRFLGGHSVHCLNKMNERQSKMQPEISLFLFPLRNKILVIQIGRTSPILNFGQICGEPFLVYVLKALKIVLVRVATFSNCLATFSNLVQTSSCLPSSIVMSSRRGITSSNTNYRVRKNSREICCRCTEIALAVE